MVLEELIRSNKNVLAYGGEAIKQPLEKIPADKVVYLMKGSTDFSSFDAALRRIPLEPLSIKPVLDNLSHKEDNYQIFTADPALYLANDIPPENLVWITEYAYIIGYARKQGLIEDGVLPVYVGSEVFKIGAAVGLDLTDISHKVREAPGEVYIDLDVLVTHFGEDSVRGLIRRYTPKLVSSERIANYFGDYNDNIILVEPTRAGHKDRVRISFDFDLYEYISNNYNERDNILVVTTTPNVVPTLNKMDVETILLANNVDGATSPASVLVEPFRHMKEWITEKGVDAKLIFYEVDNLIMDTTAKHEDLVKLFSWTHSLSRIHGSELLLHMRNACGYKEREDILSLLYRLFPIEDYSLFLSTEEFYKKSRSKWKDIALREFNRRLPGCVFVSDNLLEIDSKSRELLFYIIGKYNGAIIVAE
jgi:hypothetical protein